MDLNMDKAWKSLLMEIFTRDIFKTINRMDMESITGRTKATLRDTFQTDSGRVKGFGKRAQEIAINIRASTKTTRNGDTAFLHGQMEISSREIIRQIIDMAMDKCTGKMETTIRDNGKMASKMVKVHIAV